MPNSQPSDYAGLRDDIRKLYLAVEVLSKALARDGLIDPRFGSTLPLLDRVEALERHLTSAKDGPKA